MNDARDRPPEAWPPAHRAATAVVGPITRFLQVEAASASLLALAAVAAVVMANSRFATAYADILNADIALGIGSWSVAVPLHAFVDDGLMTVFFFVVGLEIRRELHAGELADRPRAALPLAAAVGGMVAPALFYVALNPSGPTLRGWGVPMATDIAFAVAVLAVLGKRVPAALRVLLLALAIIDDIGGVLVIAFFYSSGIAVGGLAIAAAGILATVVLQRAGARRLAAYALPAAAVWIGLHEAGVHPTMAGVALGLLTPPRTWPGRENVSPSERLQHALHPWVAFVVMPVFAFVNAGIAPDWTALDVRVAAGVFVGLVLGKPLGIVAASWLAVRIGLARLPSGVDWRGVGVVGLVGGVGFTVALFVANLAFIDATALASAKIGILAGSLLAAAAGLVAGLVVLARSSTAAAATPEDAEASAID